MRQRVQEGSSVHDALQTLGGTQQNFTSLCQDFSSRRVLEFYLRDPSFAFEFGRLSALYRYGILDTVPAPDFARIVRDLGAALDVPLVQIVMVDDQRLWTLAAIGELKGEIRKQGSLAALAIEQPDLIVIDNAENNPAFSGMMASFGETAMRAFMAAPLRTRDNHPIGIICVADRRARVFSAAHRERIRQAALLTMAAFESRLRDRVDAGTGALRRSAFEEMVIRVGMLATRRQDDLAVLAIDIDPFRLIAETLKADLGRLLLERVSRLGRADIRSFDSFGRLSENLFGVLLPSTSSDGARALSRRLIAGLSEGWAPGVQGLATIGTGVASLRSGLCQPASLVASAVGGCQVDKAAHASSRPAAPRVA